GASGRVERVQDSCRTKRVYPAVVQGRRRARTGSSIRFPEPDRIVVSPYQLASGQLVARHDLVVATLLLGVEEIASHGEGRPTRSDGLMPELDRWAARPVRLDSYPVNNPIAIGSSKAGPICTFLLLRRTRSGSLWFVSSPGQQPLFRGLCPTP